MNSDSTIKFLKLSSVCVFYIAVSLFTTISKSRTSKVKFMFETHMKLNKTRNECDNFFFMKTMIIV